MTLQEAQSRRDAIVTRVQELQLKLGNPVLTRTRFSGYTVNQSNRHELKSQLHAASQELRAIKKTIRDLSSLQHTGFGGSGSAPIPIDAEADTAMLRMLLLDAMKALTRLSVEVELTGRIRDYFRTPISTNAPVIDDDDLDVAHDDASLVVAEKLPMRLKDRFMDADLRAAPGPGAVLYKRAKGTDA